MFNANHSIFFPLKGVRPCANIGMVIKVTNHKADGVNMFLFRLTPLSAMNWNLSSQETCLNLLPHPSLYPSHFQQLRFTLKLRKKHFHQGHKILLPLILML